MVLIMTNDKEKILVLLNSIEKQITTEWWYVTQSINDYSKELESDLFECCVRLENDPKTVGANELRGRHGIYVFLINEPIELSDEEIKTFNSLKGAKLKDKSGFFACEGSCLYAGSSCADSLYVRLRNHFRGDFIGASLHLGSPERSIFLGKVTAYVFPIKKEYEPYLKIIMPALETKLHEDYIPLAGSPRT